ncbi:MAG: hypothetical protein Q8M92_08525, partial [Candidatus Subteraquimicrobiales bacterium]|nr:hypothetical protein [Candidatus Subteraquimicrobiales bacterium]
PGRGKCGENCVGASPVKTFEHIHSSVVRRDPSGGRNMIWLKLNLSRPRVFGALHPDHSVNPSC